MRVFVRCDGTRVMIGTQSLTIRRRGCTAEHHSIKAPDAVKSELISKGWTFVGTGLDARCFCPAHR